jgi:hypothetical protein
VNDFYKFTNLSNVNQSYFDSVCKSVWENETQAKGLVAKRIVNFFGYPHNIEVNLYQGSSKTEFVNIQTNEILASVETINDGTMFYTETKYYGDWFK